MKKLLYIALLFTINALVANAEITGSQAGVLEQVDAGQIFSYPESIRYIEKKYDLPMTLTESNEAMPISINQNFASSVFNKENKIIEISNFPIAPGEFKNIRLKRATPAVNLGTRWIRVTENGEELAKSFEPEFYSGTIAGVPNSKVTLLYNAGYMYCVIEQEDKDNYSITPFTNDDNKSSHILTAQRSSSISEDNNPFLEIYPINENSEEIIRKISEKVERPQSTELLQSDIIIEATSDFYRLYNNYDQVTTYIAAVMSQVSQMYEQQIYVQIFVPQVIIHENSATDPYRSTTQIYERLYQARDLWRNKTVKRSVVCLMTDIDFQGGGGYRVGGISLGLGTICENSEAYCVFGMNGHYKYPTSNYTWDVSVAEHELGHAFGSPHTHSCYFRPNMIDTCITRNSPSQGSDGCVTTGNPIPRLGTIMSYCHLTNSTRSVGMYFHERCSTIVRAYSESAPCFRRSEDPALILLEPNGGSVLFPGDKIPIRWASSKVEFVAIKYSFDNGSTWNMIAPYAEALSGEYLWTIPDTISNNVLVLIQR